MSSNACLSRSDSLWHILYQCNHHIVLRLIHPDCMSHYQIKPITRRLIRTRKPGETGRSLVITPSRHGVKQLHRRSPTNRPINCIRPMILTPAPVTCRLLSMQNSELAAFAYKNLGHPLYGEPRFLSRSLLVVLSKAQYLITILPNRYGLTRN